MKQRTDRTGGSADEPNAPDADGTSSTAAAGGPRNIRRWLVVAAATLTLVAVAVVGWMLFLSPQASSVTFAAAAQSAEVGTEVELHGTVTPAAAGRTVELQQRTAGAENNGTWRTVTTATTTSDGAFTLSVPAGQEPGVVEYRVVALEEGRSEVAHSDPAEVTVLTPSTLAVDLPRRGRTDRPTRVSGKVSPATARPVVVEFSADGGGTWSELGATTSAANGKFLITFTEDRRRSGVARVRVEPTDEHAAATSEPARFDVEDYQAAGKAYLRAVAAPNAVSAENVDLSDIDAVRAQYRSYADATSQMIADLQQFKHWPHEVRSDVFALIRESQVEVDTYRRMAKAGSFAEMDDLYYAGGLPAGRATAARIRAILGLPERPLT